MLGLCSTYADIIAEWYRGAVEDLVHSFLQLPFSLQNFNF